MFRLASRKRINESAKGDRFANRRHRNRGGAATIEMAFVAPFVFLLIFSSFEFGRMMMVRQALTNAAREGARHAALATTQNYDEVKDVVRDRLRGVIRGVDDPDILRIEITPEFTTSPASGDKITTAIDVNCSDVSLLPPLFYAGAKIFGTSSMNRE